MRDLAWRIGFTSVLLAALAMLTLNTSCSPAQQLLEQALGQTPEAQIAAYMSAIATGERQAALDLWLEPGASHPALATRRQSVTDELLVFGPSLGYRVLEVEWWRTCCEPGVIDEPEQAGGARVRVEVSAQGHPAAVYFFGLQVPGGYWGAAEGNRVREWVILDVYPENAAPLAWPWG
jgi:hypothetical protein